MGEGEGEGLERATGGASAPVARKGGWRSRADGWRAPGITGVPETGSVWAEGAWRLPLLLLDRFLRGLGGSMRSWMKRARALRERKNV